jgi:hypothetical protein
MAMGELRQSISGFAAKQVITVDANWNHYVVGLSKTGNEAFGSPKGADGYDSDSGNQKG